MKENKKAGIWMDHSSANILEIVDNFIITKNVKSEHGFVRESSINDKDETHHQNKNQQQLADYYKTISEILKKYDEIVLFGPTDAKTELLNLLQKDKQFNDKIISVKTTDKMTDKQQNAFVSDYFSPNVSAK